MKISNIVKKINLLDGYLFISFLLIWLSINSGPIDIYKFFENLNFIYLNLSITDKYIEISLLIINFFRAIFPLLIFTINIFIIFLSFDKIILNKFYKNYAILFFLFFTFFQILALVLKTQDNFFYSIYWNFAMMAVLTLYIILDLKKKKFNNFFFIISILLLWIVLIIFAFPTLKDFIYSTTTAYGTETLSISSISFDQPRPRVTGLSRTALILYIFHLCFFLKDTSFHYLKILNFVLFIILSFLIFLFLSRGAVAGIIITNFLLLILYNNIKIFKKIILIILITIIPISLSVGVNKIKANYFIQDETLKTKYKEKNKREIQERYFGFLKEYLNLDNLNKEYEQRIGDSKSEWKSWSRDKKVTVFLSERNLFWKAIINKSKESILIGFGTQADRRFTDMPVSNGYLYSLICGGVISLLLLIIFLILIIKNIIVILKNKLINNNLYILNASLMLIVFFIFRILFENSFLIFGIDFLIFIQSCIYLENFYNKNE